VIHIRNRRKYKGDGVYVGRPTSPLGNPFSHVPSKYADVMVATRDEAVDRYEPWLREKLQTDPQVRKAFDDLVQFYRDFGELILICWCEPKRCHAGIIKRLILEAVGAEASHQEHQEQSQALEAAGGSSSEPT